MKNPHLKAIVAFLVSILVIATAIGIGWGIALLLYYYLYPTLSTVFGIFAVYQVINLYREAIEDFRKHPEETLW